MTYWCSDHQQFEHYSPHTPDSAYEELRADNERLRAAVVEIGAAHVAAQAEIERLRQQLESHA